MIRLDEKGNKIFTIELNLDPDFVDALDYLYEKYHETFQFMNGLHNSNLNFSDFIDSFSDSVVLADITIDSSANSFSQDVCSLTNDMIKPHTKLLSINKIFYEIKKKYNIETARTWLENEWNGATYLHNATSGSFKPYCFAYDLDKLVERGLFFINHFKTECAKHLTTFNDHVLEFIGWNSNRTSGACGLPSYLIYSWYFWDKDVKNNLYLKDPEYYRRQCFQKFIHDLSQPYLRITEAAFTNITIMDRCYLTELFGGREFPDGTFAIDHIDEILEHQKVFMEVVAEIRSKMMFTFPVLTYSLLFQNGKFVDEEFARWCNKHNMIWSDSNFYVGSDVTSLSNCCFDGRQSVTLKVGNNIYTGPFKRMYQTFYERNDVFAYYNGEWKSIKLFAEEKKHPIFHIKTSAGREMYATDDHIHLTTEGEKKSYQLEIGMYLKIETHPVDKISTDLSGKDEIVLVERVDQEGDWVFCVECLDKENPYFDLANGIQTHNCRLISDTSKLDAFINSIGGTSLSIGSLQVNTINLRRISLESNGSEEKFMEILKDRIDINLKVLDCIRHIIQRNNEKGLLPNYHYGLIDIKKQYNTLGITAMYEVMHDFGYIDEDEFGNKYYSDKALNFATRILDQINKQKDSYDFDYSINVENVPGERCNVISCKKDQALYPDAEKYYIYSNQWIPLMERCTLKEKIRLGSILDKKCGGGQISHINLESPFTNEEQAWNMLVYIASQGVIYFAYNTKISVCENGHGFYGDTCPTCGKPAVDQYTRVVGFLTPVSTWSRERRQEFDDRQWFDKSDWYILNDSVVF